MFMYLQKCSSKFRTYWNFCHFLFVYHIDKKGVRKFEIKACFQTFLGFSRPKKIFWSHKYKKYQVDLAKSELYWFCIISDPLGMCFSVFCLSAIDRIQQFRLQFKWWNNPKYNPCANFAIYWYTKRRWKLHIRIWKWGRNLQNRNQIRNWRS